MNLKQLHIEINVGNYFKIRSTPLPVPQFLKLISLCLSSSNGNLPYCKFFFFLESYCDMEKPLFCHPDPQGSDGPKSMQQNKKKVNW